MAEIQPYQNGISTISTISEPSAVGKLCWRNFASSSDTIAISPRLSFQPQQQTIPHKEYRLEHPWKYWINGLFFSKLMLSKWYQFLLFTFCFHIWWLFLGYCMLDIRLVDNEYPLPILIKGLFLSTRNFSINFRPYQVRGMVGVVRGRAPKSRCNELNELMS